MSIELMTIFKEILHRLSSKTRMRQLLIDVSPADLSKIIYKMQQILNDKENQHLQEESSRQQKNNSINVIKKLMSDHGLSPSDFNAYKDNPSTNERRNKQKYTFAYKTIQGKSIEWEGVTMGRLPASFRQYLERTGKKRMDCVIKAETI